MKVDFTGNAPINLTLNSGTSFYAYPKQKDLYISEQDWMLTKKLKLLKQKNLFRVVDESEDEPKTEKKAVKAADMIFEESVPRFEQQPETFDFNSHGQLIGTRPLTKEDKKNKIYKKKVKIKESAQE